MSERGGWCQDCLMPFNRIVFEYVRDRLTMVLTPDDCYSLSPGEQWDYRFLSRYVGWHVVEVRHGEERRHSVIERVTAEEIWLSPWCRGDQTIH